MFMSHINWSHGPCVVVIQLASSAHVCGQSQIRSHIFWDSMQILESSGQDLQLVVVVDFVVVEPECGRNFLRNAKQKS
jgi:hypothetical protein